jgi:hypothetical protein
VNRWTPADVLALTTVIAAALLIGLLIWRIT